MDDAEHDDPEGTHPELLEAPLNGPVWQSPDQQRQAKCGWPVLCGPTLEADTYLDPGVWPQRASSRPFADEPQIGGPGGKRAREHVRPRMVAVASNYVTLPRLQARNLYCRASRGCRDRSSHVFHRRERAPPLLAASRFLRAFSRRCRTRRLPGGQPTWNR